MSSKQDLLPCPFCGKKATIGANRDHVIYSTVYCNGCGLEASWYHDNAEEAAEHWNRRMSVEEAENERLKEIEHQIFQLKAERDDILTTQALRKEKNKNG